MSLALSFIITLAIIFVVPIVVYGLFAAAFSLKKPDKKMSFFAGVLMQKVGTAVGFVGLFYIGREYFADNWFAYS